MECLPATSPTRPPSSTPTTSWPTTALAQLVEAAQTNKPTSYLETGSATTRTRTSSSRRATARRPARSRATRPSPSSNTRKCCERRPCRGASWRGGLPAHERRQVPDGRPLLRGQRLPLAALTASKDAKVAYTGTPVVAHTVGDSRQTTAGIDGADAEKLGGYFPNLNAIASELIEDKAPAFFLREFASFLSRSKWIVSRQQDPKLRAKFARILQRTARDFVDAAATYVPREDLLSEFDDNDHVKFFGDDEAPRVELSVVIPTKDAGKQITDLLTSLTNVPLSTEVFVVDVDDGSTDDTVEAVQKFRGTHDNVYLLRDSVSKGAGRARNRAAPLLEGAFTVYVDADDLVDARALGAAVRELRANDEADLLFFPYQIDQSGARSGPCGTRTRPPSRAAVRPRRRTSARPPRCR